MVYLFWRATEVWKQSSQRLRRVALDEGHDCSPRGFTIAIGIKRSIFAELLNSTCGTPKPAIRQPQSHMGLKDGCWNSMLIKDCIRRMSARDRFEIVDYAVFSKPPREIYPLTEAIQVDRLHQARRALREYFDCDIIAPDGATHFCALCKSQCISRLCSRANG